MVKYVFLRDLLYRTQLLWECLCIADARGLKALIGSYLRRSGEVTENRKSSESTGSENTKIYQEVVSLAHPSVRPGAPVLILAHPCARLVFPLLCAEYWRPDWCAGARARWVLGWDAYLRSFFPQKRKPSIPSLQGPFLGDLDHFQTPFNHSFHASNF